MKKQKMRVVLASEYPEVRNFLTEIIESGDRAIVVGQADNAPKAMALVRNLRPDVAVVDCYLPYNVGLDAAPLSRMSGLDTAQVISKEIPNTKVILLNNLNDPELLKNRLAPIAAFFSGEMRGTSTPLVMEEPRLEEKISDALVFAHVEAEPALALNQRVTNISDKAIFFGGIGVMGGLALVLTLLFAGAGVLLSLAGLATMFLGLVGKLSASLRLKMLRKGSS